MSLSSAYRRIFPSPLLKASLALHVIAIAAVPFVPGTWPLWLAALVADHLILSTVGLVPRGDLLGPNVVHLPGSSAERGEVAITIDDGPDPRVTPAVLEILAAHGARATFFCVGECLRRNPELARSIVDGGHEIANHTATHPYTFSMYGIRALEREIAGGQDAIASVTGTESRYFRAPAGLRNPLVQPILSRRGLRLVSWTRRGFDTVQSDAATVLGRLVRDLKAGDILLLHDGRAARDASGQPVILGVLPALLDACRTRGLVPVTLRDALDPDGRSIQTGS